MESGSHAGGGGGGGGSSADQLIGTDAAISAAAIVALVEADSLVQFIGFLTSSGHVERDGELSFSICQSAETLWRAASGRRGLASVVGEDTHGRCRRGA